MTKRTILALVAALSIAGAPGAAPAQNLIDPFGPEAATLSRDDLALMRGAIEAVLAGNKVGGTAQWKSASSGVAGRAALRKTFKQNDMPCGEVEHVFTAGGKTRYVLPFCKTKAGQWKLAF